MALTAATIFSSIRDQIPDPNSVAFSDATLLRWVNDAMRVIAMAAPIVRDWYALASITGMDLYTLPDTILTVEQLWYDMLPCLRNAEYDTLGPDTVQGQSFYFGPHSQAGTSVLQVWPTASRTASTTTLTSTASTTASTLSVASTTSFNQWGFVSIDAELILYRNITATTIVNLLRGQGMTTAASHNAGATVQELNIVFKTTRLPVAVTTTSDPLEMPVALIPLIELYVLAKVREAESEGQMALALRREFQQTMKLLEEKASLAGLRQGIQVRPTDAAPVLYGGRLIVP